MIAATFNPLTEAPAEVGRWQPLMEGRAYGPAYSFHDLALGFITKAQALLPMNDFDLLDVRTGETEREKLERWTLEYEATEEEFDCCVTCGSDQPSTCGCCPSCLNAPGGCEVCWSVPVGLAKAA